MDIFTLLLLSALGFHLLKSSDQKNRIALLGSHLNEHQLEKLMESLTEGYLRALGESDPERRAQVWSHLGTAELALGAQFKRFVAEFAQVEASAARVSKLAFALPYAARIFPFATFDLRKALAIHARGIMLTAQNSEGRSLKDKAFTLSAELFLMQHTCHWFCRSKTVASARMIMRHQTTYEQVLAAVTPETRRAYGALIGA